MLGGLTYSTLTRCPFTFPIPFSFTTICPNKTHRTVTVTVTIHGRDTGYLVCVCFSAAPFPFLPQLHSVPQTKLYRGYRNTIVSLMSIIVRSRDLFTPMRGVTALAVSLHHFSFNTPWFFNVRRSEVEEFGHKLLLSLVSGSEFTVHANIPLSFFLRPITTRNQRKSHGFPNGNFIHYHRY